MVGDDSLLGYAAQCLLTFLSLNKPDTTSNRGGGSSQRNTVFLAFWVGRMWGSGDNVRNESN